MACDLSCAHLKDVKGWPCSHLFHGFREFLLPTVEVQAVCNIPKHKLLVFVLGGKSCFIS